MKIRPILLGAVLTIGLNLTFGLIAAASRSAGIATLLGAAALLLAGLVTVLVMPASQPREPAIGAALVTAVIAGVELIVYARRVPNPPLLSLLASWVLAVAFAGALSWIGARAMKAARRPRPTQPTQSSP